MAQMFSLGALGTWAALHIVSLLFVWGFDLGGPRVCGADVTIQSWACDTPFERAVVSRPDETNFFARAVGVMSGVFGVIFGFLSFDYPIFATEGVFGIIGTCLQLMSWLALAVVAAGLGLRLFGRA